MPRSTGLFQQLPEVFVPMPISLSFYMKVIMAQLMLDDAGQLFQAILPVSFRIDLNVMVVEPVSAAGRPEPRIKIDTVPECAAKRFQ
jgi:hypothetical protein